MKQAPDTSRLIAVATVFAALAAFGGVVVYPGYDARIERDCAYAVRSSARAIRASSKLPNENRLNCRTKTIQTAERKPSKLPNYYCAIYHDML